ncbi:hypothetical protein VNO78_04879 [Psophocarpus tetragonolobus]|uniref:Uncharacterized protein n=1 Tax=Psophocarpus tetragonolobus TaxID=3891 RepID=A0AAN9XXS1_PSOTE
MEHEHKTLTIRPVKFEPFPKVFRISYVDQDATESSSDEEGEDVPILLPRVKKVVNEIRFVCIENKTGQDSDQSSLSTLEDNERPKEEDKETEVSWGDNNLGVPGSD